MTSAWSLAETLIRDQGWHWAVVAARVSGLAATAPAWGSPALGWRLRIVLILAITFAVAPAVEVSGRPEWLENLGPILLAELGIGASLGLSASLVIAGARQAGELVGAQAGLSPASLLDPEAGADLNAMGHLYGLVALGTFLALNGPLMLVGSLVESYQAIPAGGMSLDAETVESTFARVALALALALRGAAPAALALILAGLALGLLGRAAPSLGMMSLALPARALAGLLIALLGLAGAAGVFAAAWPF